MNLNLERPIAFIDLETTGVDVATDRIVEIAILKINPDGSKTMNRKLVNPTIPIPPVTSAIHGITDKDVEDAPTFEKLAPSLFKFLFDCDLAGYNSNKFDVPLLVEEFLRAGVHFDVKDRHLIDVQNIFHKMEQRTLSAAYKFYCNKNLDNAHTAEADTTATYEVLEAQLEKYSDLKNDMSFLEEFSRRNHNVDLAGRFIYNEDGKEIFNFGKHKGKLVTDVLKEEPGYYGWILNGNFTLETKNVLKEIKNRKS